MPHLISRRHASLLALEALGFGVAATRRGRAARSAPLTLYNGQHPQVTALLAARFTKETGIAVRIHSGNGPEIADQIILEGAHSPADVYFTENSPELVLLDEKDLLTSVDRKTLDAVPRKYSAPNGHWVGVLARQNVLTFDPRLIRASALPRSLLDLAKPEWKSKIAIAPGDADFFPLVGALVALYGEAEALSWLRGMRHNAAIYADDEAVVAAVNRAAVATGIINNYYWARLRVEVGAKHITCRLHHFGAGDVGNLINISGAAVLRSSKHKSEAQRFLAFLVARSTQEMLGKSNVDFEYPLVPGVAANPIVTPFDELRPPPVSITALGNDRLAVMLVRKAGLI